MKEPVIEELYRRIAGANGSITFVPASRWGLFQWEQDAHVEHLFKEKGYPADKPKFKDI